MSIIVTNRGLEYLRDNLSRQLEVFEITRSEIETEIIIPLITSIPRKMQEENREIIKTLVCNGTGRRQRKNTFTWNIFRRQSSGVNN